MCGASGRIRRGLTASGSPRSESQQEAEGGGRGKEGEEEEEVVDAGLQQLRSSVVRWKTHRDLGGAGMGNKDGKSAGGVPGHMTVDTWDRRGSERATLDKLISGEQDGVTGGETDRDIEAGGQTD